MRFDLVLATRGRTDELRRFLEALSQQTHGDFSLYLIDQNEDDRVEDLLSRLELGFDPTVLHSARGLSRGRNVALRELRGDVVGFPDDDCWYPPELLERVARLFEESGADGVAGRPLDAEGRPSSGRWDAHPGAIDPRTVWHRAISFTIFLRRQVVESVGAFDEGLGPGAAGGRWSGDETDYLLRALERGFALRYDPALEVGHAEPTDPHGDRALHYGAGAGAILRKHRYPLSFAIPFVLRPLGGAALALARGRREKARGHLNGFRGRLVGWLGVR
jgi:glycosyltransferase involved in cell wall biosynthesis